jgi:hypothetical protein
MSHLTKKKRHRSRGCSDELSSNKDELMLGASSIIVKANRLGNAYKISVAKPQGKRPLERPGRRWEDIRLNLTEIGCGECGLDAYGSE